MRRIDLRREDGVAMTEFALVLPVFVLIIVGLLAFGRVFFYWIEANHLASETARWAVVDRNPYAPGADAAAARGAGLHDRVRERRATSASTSRPASSSLGDPVAGTGPEAVHTSSRSSASGTITIRGSSTMRIENFGTRRRDGDPLNYRRRRHRRHVGTCT